MINPYFSQEFPFVTFQPTESKVTQLDDPLYGPQNLDWADHITSNGVPVVKNPIMINDNPEIVETMSTPQESQQEAKPQQETTSSKKTKVNLSGNKKKAMEFFQSKGLAPHQAAGLVGNLIRESQLNPSALNKSSGAMGIAQWLGSRKRNLIAKYGKNPSFEQQLQFVWDELNSTHKMGLKTLLESRNAEEAAANAFGWFEFSVGPQGAIQEMNKYGQAGQKSYDQGIKFANSLLENDQK